MEKTIIHPPKPFTMPTRHCRKCTPEKRCGNGHIYVVQLKTNKQGYAGHLYVGKTGKSVEERFQDNLTRRDGKLVTMLEAHMIGEDRKWKYNTRSSKLIRSSYKKHRPDLEYFKRNPILRNDGDAALDAAEVKLAQDLRKRGWFVEQA